ncbi:hypothetical protein [Pseudoxanthomonas japonensis]|uniref:hypothetical protein n=1 Tax=Pseudoxanthomonas japonensis TaxID=69284 RepID=UPI00374888D2
MSDASNPYDAPRASLPAPDGTSMPPAVRAIIACYLVHLALEILPLYATPMARFELFTPSMVVIGLYGVAMSVALWRKQQWARVWLVLTTVMAAFLLGRLLWRGVSFAQWPAVAAGILRIAVGAMLFLPSVRRWFAPPRT